MSLFFYLELRERYDNGEDPFEQTQSQQGGFQGNPFGQFFQGAGGNPFGGGGNPFGGGGGGGGSRGFHF